MSEEEQPVDTFNLDTKAKLSKRTLSKHLETCTESEDKQRRPSIFQPKVGECECAHDNNLTKSAHEHEVKCLHEQICNEMDN